MYGSDQALSYAVVDELRCQAEGLRFASVLPDPATVMSAEQLASYEATEGRVAEPHTVAGYAAVELIVKTFEKAGALDAGAAATQARQTTTRTLIGELSFDSSGNLLDPRIHFFQIQGRQLKEAFARAVGAPPEAGLGTAGSKTTILNRDFPSGKEAIVFAGLNWDSAQFANSVARLIIEGGYEYPTHSPYGSSVPLFQSLRKGDVHVYMEGWLPNLQELYDKAVAERQIADLGLYFGDAVQGWFVPRYVIEGDPARGIEAVAPDLRTVDDLERYSQLFPSREQPGIGRFIGGSSGWASYKIDCMKLKAYRLDDNYAQITSGSEAALFATLDTAYEKGEPILTYMYEPSWPIARFDLVQIAEPDFSEDVWRRNKGVAFPLTQVRKLVHTDLQTQAPDVIEFLGNVSLTSEEISRVLKNMKEQNLSPEEAARAWVAENEAVWSGWVSPGVAAKVTQALAE